MHVDTYFSFTLFVGDLSEYNILWHQSKPVIIDVSQSVEHAHPYATEFLKKDLSNLTDFFSKRCVKVFSNFALFQLVTSKDILPLDAGYERVFEYLQEELEKLEMTAVTADEITEERQIEEAVFLQSYIPTSLGEISNPHVEMRRMETGQRENAFQAAVEGMLRSVHAEESEDGEEEGSGEEEEESEDDEDDENSDDEVGDEKYRRRLPGHDNVEDRQRAKELRKEQKKLAKEAAAQRRLTKIPKHVKKRAVKSGKKK